MLQIKSKNIRKKQSDCFSIFEIFFCLFFQKNEKKKNKNSDILSNFFLIFFFNSYTWKQLISFFFEENIVGLSTLFILPSRRTRKNSVQNCASFYWTLYITMSFIGAQCGARGGRDARILQKKFFSYMLKRGARQAHRWYCNKKNSLE